LQEGGLMGGRAPLKAYAPRLLGHHDGAEGREYRRAYDALAEEFNLSRPLLRLQAGRAAVAWCQMVTANKALRAAQRKQRVGRGRRPGDRRIEALAHRQALADAAYSQMLRELQELAGRNGHGPPSISDLVAQRRASG
jgi:hypothetical protein